MKTIRAKVNKRLLAKADRLFTGTLSGRIIEVLQNARRAGATQVDITNKDGWVTVHDNGKGIKDFSGLLDMGGSDWDAKVEQSEDPAGVGLFCLAPRLVVVRSGHRYVTLNEPGWTGDLVAVKELEDSVSGTVLRFQDEPWSLEKVEMNAVFSGLKVTVGGQVCKSLPFVGDSAAAHPELGCRIEACNSSRISGWYSTWRNQQGYGNVLVNFHGQVVTFEYRPISDRSMFFLVDMTGEPTGIRLMLPARTRLVENDAFETLKRALEVEAYRFWQRAGEHTLEYKEFLRAKELGIELPEAKPVYELGLIGSCDSPEPAEVRKPEELSLDGCYRLSSGLADKEDGSDANAHLLAALGKLEAPFVPVRIASEYDGYSWAKLATIDKVKVRLGKELLTSDIWSGTLTCVESIGITAHTSDGKVFGSPVCMAVQPPEGEHARWMDGDHVYVTPEAEKQLDTAEIWFHLGGWYEEGNSYETQEADFSEELEAFWADLVGPDENWRLKLVEAAGYASRSWQSITINQEGSVEVVLVDGSTKRIQPPAEKVSTAAAA